MILLFWGVGLAFILLAVPLRMRKVPPNSLYGVRLSETLADEAVWYEVNARSALDLMIVGGGTAVIASGLYFLPWNEPDHYTLVCGALLTIGCIAYAVRAVKTARVVQRELHEPPG